jgi:hypothetical protein
MGELHAAPREPMGTDHPEIPDSGEVIEDHGGDIRYFGYLA